jgi:hypothetical protein
MANLGSLGNLQPGDGKVKPAVTFLFTIVNNDGEFGRPPCSLGTPRSNHPLSCALIRNRGLKRKATLDRSCRQKTRGIAPRAKFRKKVAQGSKTITQFPSTTCTDFATAVPLFARRGASGTPFRRLPQLKPNVGLLGDNVSKPSLRVQYLLPVGTTTGGDEYPARQKEIARSALGIFDPAACLIGQSAARWSLHCGSFARWCWPATSRQTLVRSGPGSCPGSCTP